MNNSIFSLISFVVLTTKNYFANLFVKITNANNLQEYVDFKTVNVRKITRNVK